MGLAILMIYIPALLITSAVAVTISGFVLRGADKTNASKAQKFIAYIFGALASLLITSSYAWWNANITLSEWGPIAGSITISLVGPPAVGLFFWVMSVFLLKKKPHILKYAAAGALWATIVMPVFGFFVYSASDNIYEFVYRSTFDEKCKGAALLIKERVEPAKSFAVVPRYIYPSGYGFISPELLLHVDGTTLEFVEKGDEVDSGRLELKRYVRGEKNGEKTSGVWCGVIFSQKRKWIQFLPSIW